MNLYIRETYLKRIREFYHKDDLVKVLTGIRHCGKSSLMYMIADELKASGVPESKIMYFDLDRREYRSIVTADQLKTLILLTRATDELKYLFISQIQNVQHFETVIHDFITEGNWSIFITGSNSYFLKDESVKKQIGKCVEVEVFPLNFQEYEGMKAFFGKTISPRPMTELKNYILEGGFPKMILLDRAADKRKYIQDVASEIYEKDIYKYSKIKNKEAFKAVFQYIVCHFGTGMSFRDMCEEIKKTGVLTDFLTVAKYINVLVDAKILYDCPRLNMKSQRLVACTHKYYLSNLSFYSTANKDNGIDYEPLLENIVYIHAGSNNYSIHVGRFGKYECDFVVQGTNMQYAYLQVVDTLASDEEKEDREYYPLEHITDGYSRYMITTDNLLPQRNGIKHINLIKFIGKNELF